MAPTPLPPDGERYLREFKGTIELEHFHRYHLARSLVSGRDVIDIACGEGYGSDILAAAAKSVVGVDISEAAIKHATFHYRDPRIFFRVGSATDIPLPDASVDMAVSFETIEHLEDHERMMGELHRVLRPGGLLMISSPSKLEYSDKPGYSNRFHVRELYTHEFRELVGRYFANTKHYGQRLSAASLIADDRDAAPFRIYAGSGVRNGIPEARYDILLASDGDLPTLPHSAFEIPESDLQPYAAEALLAKLRAAGTDAEHGIAKAEQGKAEVDWNVAQRDRTIAELRAYLSYAVGAANDVLTSKWWQRTRTFRRWSNSLRKRRGRPKKVWPERLDFPDASSGPTGPTTEVGWPTYVPLDGVPPPFGIGITHPNVPIVRYSGVTEGFTRYREYEPLKPLVRAIAFYLPQFHPFPENDSWWGKGFTEWTNVGKAQPLFPQHYQPHCPIHLGYYDLRLPEIMREQARLARNYGISGFAYYFYWFAGKLLMETPLETMLGDPQVDIPFCLIWANENWTRRWDGLDEEVLISQDHSLDDSRAMLRYLQKFMMDERYIRIDGKPLLIVYRAAIIPDFSKTVAMWREEAETMGLGGLYIVSAQTSDHRPEEFGLDAAVQFPPNNIDAREVAPAIYGLNPAFEGGIYDYDALVSREATREAPSHRLFRTSMLSWDNTPRRGLKASVFVNFSVTRYSQWLAATVEAAAKDTRSTPDERLVFVNAWNEWAEGTHLEPDQKHGYGYLDATRAVLANYRSDAAPFVRPDIPSSTSARYAIVAHVHYADTWSDMSPLIRALPDVDVYVTVTDLDAARAVAEDMPHAVIELVDNRGRDVRPFLMTLERIAHLNYRAVCKVHGKKSVYRADGETIRRSLLKTLIDDRVMTRFDEHDNLGLVAANSSILSHDTNNMANNQRLVEDIAQDIGVPFVAGRFVAGTMFWVDPKAIAPLLTLRANDFDIERGLADGTRAHAIERMFLGVVEHSNYQILGV